MTFLSPYMQGEVAVAKGRVAGLRQRDTNVPTTSAPEHQQALQKQQAAQKPRMPAGGRSLSAILQSRSEAASSEAELAHSDADERQPQSPMPDIDSKDKHNPLAAAEYASDIFGYYRRIEKLYRPAPNYMSHQVTNAASLMSSMSTAPLVKFVIGNFGSCC